MADKTDATFPVAVPPAEVETSTNSENGDQGSQLNTEAALQETHFEAGMEVDEDKETIDAGVVEDAMDATESTSGDQHDDEDEEELSKITLEEKTSFHVVQPGAPPVEATVYQATWTDENLSLGSLFMNPSLDLNARPISESVDDNGRKKPSATGKKGKNPSGIPIYLPKPKPFYNPGFDGMGGSGGSGSSRPPSNIMFKDCGGLEKQVNFIRTAIMEPINRKNSREYTRFALDPPKGVLFYGSPGTGKTRLAHAIGNELKAILGQNVHFIYRKGNDVASKFFGQSAQNLRNVFQEAIRMKPTVLFFDELDGLCPSRDQSFIGQAYITTVTTMLGLMDELPVGEVFVIGATNRLEAVDAAMKRPGRFDKYLEFLPPSEDGRLKILEIHTSKWKVKPEKDVLKRMSQKTVGFSGADLAKLCLDAFDNAMDRLIPKSAQSYRNLNFQNLTVEERDWNSALKKMRPSNSAVFGSTLFTPAKSLGEHVEILMKSNIESVKEMLTPLLPSYDSGVTGINSFYFWHSTQSCMENLDDLVVSPLLRSKEFDKYPVFSVSTKILSTVPWSRWAQKVNDVFTQAIESHQPGILFFQEVDELWESISTSKIGSTIDIKKQLERMRGKPVLLLATSSTSPHTLQWDNSFRYVFAGSNRVYELVKPDEVDRSAFFEHIFLTNSSKWEEDDAVEDFLDEAASATENSEIADMIMLYDNINQALIGSGTGQAMKSVEDVLNFFKVRGLFPR